MPLTPEQGKAKGEALKLTGLALAALRKEHDVKAAQLAMLNAAMSRADRTCSANDIPADLATEYGDGGKWVGAAVRALALAHVTVKVGFDVSARPSRHGGDVKLWRVPDDARCDLFRRALRLWLACNPLPPNGDDDADGTLFPATLTPQKPSPAAATVGLAMTKGNDQ